MTVIAQVPIPGGIEVVLILLVLVLLFGAQRIPRLARAVGSSIGEFQKGRQELENELEDVQNDVQQEAKVVEDEFESAKQDISGSSNPQRQAEAEAEN